MEVRGMSSVAAGRPADRDRDPVLRFLTALVAAALGVDWRWLAAPSRGKASVAFARQVAMYLAHTVLALTYAQVGAAFGRDRTTAAYACRIVEERRDDSRVDALVGLMERALADWPRHACR